MHVPLVPSKGAPPYSVKSAFFLNLFKAGNIKAAPILDTKLFSTSSFIISRIIDWTDRTTAVLFGDGAGAVVISKSNSSSDILSTVMKSDGSYGHLLHCQVGEKLRMQGRETFKQAVKSMETACLKALQKAGINKEDIKLVIPHQANIRIIQALAEKLELPLEKVYSNIHKYGNTSAASIPIAMYEAYKEGRFNKGDYILLTAFGGGLTWGAAVIRF